MDDNRTAAGDGPVWPDDGQAASAARLFAGRWSILRNIYDVDSQWAGRFDGTAVFSPAPGEAGATLDYHEAGELRFAGLVAYHATRDYRWRFRDGNAVEVDFDDGRPFHGFVLGPGRATARHHCEPDQYDVVYDFSRWPEWQSEWRVVGPRKDYRMVSLYRRQD